MSQGRFITPTINVAFDLLAALVIEAILTDGVHGDSEALVILDAEQGSINVRVTGQTPWTFIYDVSRDTLSEIQQTDIYREAVERSYQQFREMRVVRFIPAPTE
ncbi:MAG: hypothetical protein E7K79_09670 [Actinomyces urogenitalis]|nr:hypothetical protein [Actinomyces urogenitalis]